MSGSCFSSGKLTNDGKKLLEISDILDGKIMSLDIYNIPLSEGLLMSSLRLVGKIIQPFIHPSLSPSLCHIAIKLDIENIKDVIIIEYGQYYSEDSKEEEKQLFASGSSSCSNEPREEYNNYKYYYINTDGVRITRIKNDLYVNNEYIAKIISVGMLPILYNLFPGIAAIHYLSLLVNATNIIKCDVNNKISLRNLIALIKGEKWLAKQYNLLSHNCQDFGAEIVKILKSIRINEKDKIRMREKMILPNCLINALSENENSSTINTIGKIPVFGLFFDLFAFIKK